MNMYLVYHRLYITPVFIISECDNILGLINNRSESPRNPAPDFEEFKLSMNERLTNQETLLLRIAQELGLDKPKQQ